MPPHRMRAPCETASARRASSLAIGVWEMREPMSVPTRRDWTRGEREEMKAE